MSLIQSNVPGLFESVLLNAPFIALAIVFLWNLFDASAFGWFSLVNGPFIIITEFFTIYASDIIHYYTRDLQSASEKIRKSLPIYLIFLFMITVFSLVFGFILFVYFLVSTIPKTISFSRSSEKVRTGWKSFVRVQMAAFIFLTLLTLLIFPVLLVVFPLFNQSAVPTAEPGFSLIPASKGVLISFWGFCYFSAISLYSIKMQLKKASSH